MASSRSCCATAPASASVARTGRTSKRRWVKRCEGLERGESQKSQVRSQKSGRPCDFCLSVPAKQPAKDIRHERLTVLAPVDRVPGIARRAGQSLAVGCAQKDRGHALADGNDA